MTPEELLRRYPRETLRWLRRRLGMGWPDLTQYLRTTLGTVAAREARGAGIAPLRRAHLAALLAPHLATPEGAAFARSLGRGEGGGPGHHGAGPRNLACAVLPAYPKGAALW
jgi:hypothetical protein